MDTLGTIAIGRHKLTFRVGFATLGIMFSLNEAPLAFVSRHLAFVATIILGDDECMCRGLKAFCFRQRGASRQKKHGGAK